MVASFSSQGTDLPIDALVVAGDDLMTRQITVLSGQVVKRGALLGKITTGGKYKLSLTASADGSEVPHVILAEDVDATGGDKLAPAYFGGVFDENCVIYGASHTAASVREALRAKGIKLQPSIL